VPAPLPVSSPCPSFSKLVREEELQSGSAETLRCKVR